MSATHLLAILAALLIGAPALAMPGGPTIWVALCDPGHPGRRIPLSPGGGKACHAACATLADKRAAKRTLG